MEKKNTSTANKHDMMPKQVIDFSQRPKENKRIGGDLTDRSGSIQGRKLSFCDAHLTVSQNTIENQEKALASQRERETIQQRLSARGFPRDSILQAQELPKQKRQSPQRSPIKRSPLKESRYSHQPSQQQIQNNNNSVMMSQKQQALLRKGNQFNLTFNNHKDTAADPSKQGKSHKNKENKDMMQQQQKKLMQNRPLTAMLPKRVSPNQSPIKLPFQQKKKPEEKSSPQRKYNINQIIRDNLSRHGQMAKNQEEKLVYEEVEKRLKQSLLKAKNKQIREKNRESKSRDKSPVQMLNQHPKMHTIEEASALKMQSKSPMRRFDEFRNRDMPLKVNNEDKHVSKKKYDLGLEIFQLKKEMGLFGEDKQQVSLDKILTERSKRKQIVKQQKEQKQKEEIQLQLIQKHQHQENPQLQKLISKQQKKRLKEQKKQKIALIIDQQRVLSNLKTLNENTEQRRVGRKQQQSVKQFKTVINNNQNESNSNNYNNINMNRSTQGVERQQQQQIVREYSKRAIGQERDRSLSQKQSQNKKQIKQNKVFEMHTRASPEAQHRSKQKLNIKIKSNQAGQMHSMYHPISSSRRSLEHKAQQRISIRVPKTKILYSSVAAQQDQSTNFNQKSIEHVRLKVHHDTDQRQSMQDKKHNKQKQKLIKEILSQFDRQRSVSATRPNRKQQSRSKSFTRKSSQSKGHKQSRRNHIISIDSVAQNHSKSFLQPARHDQSRLSSSPQRNQRDSPESRIIDQLQPSEGAVNISMQSENVLIDDEMMIFCVLTTAASIIQRCFRRFMFRKRFYNHRRSQISQLHQPPSMILSDEMSSSQLYDQQNLPQLSESTKLENRLLPFSQKRDEPATRKKTPKHTFSFGNYDEQQMHLQNQAQLQQMHSGNKILIAQDNSFRLDSDPVDDSMHLFFNHPMKSESPLPVKRNLQEEFKESQNSSHDIDKLLAINNDKFKYALRSLAEKQKKTDIFQKIRGKQQPKDARDQNTQQSIEQPSSSALHSQRKSQRQVQHYIPERAPSSRMSERNPIISQDDYSLQALQDEIEKFTDDRHVKRSPFGGDKIVSSRFKQEAMPESGSEEDFIIVQKVLKEEQRNNDSSLSSLLASKGERTDKIIFYSPKNTNEQLIEAAVNESNILNNEESSIMINESNTMSNQVNSSSQQKLSSSGADKEEIKIDAFVNQPIFDYKFKPEPGYKSNRERLGYLRDPNQQDILSQDEDSRHILSQEMFPDDKDDEEDDQEDYGIEQDKDLDLYGDDQSYQENNLLSLPKSTSSQRPILRLMFGDEKFLQDHQYDMRQFSLEGSPHAGSAPSTNRMLENPYFLATNGSIFERNPFKEYTTNKLNDILQGKSQNELQKMKEDALQFQEKLEQGYINRLEKREELTPRSSQRRKYELERWVSAERQKVQKPSLEDSKPINLFDLEQDRKEAAAIIEQVNRKAKEIRQNLRNQQQQQQYQAELNAIHIQDQLQQYPGKEEEDLSSSQMLDLSAEVLKEKELTYGMSRMPELSLGNEGLSQNSMNNKQEELPTVVLDISFEDEEQEDSVHEELKFLQAQNVKFTADKIETKSQKDQGYGLKINALEVELQKLNEARKEDELSQRRIMQDKNFKADQLTQLIFSEFLAEETQILLNKAEIVMNENQKKINQDMEYSQAYDQEPIEEIKVQQQRNLSDKSDEEHKQMLSQFSNERYNQLIKPQQILEASVKELTSTSIIPQQKRMGIETSDEAIEQYVDEIFSQITLRREQFLQAFITPIYKNPLEILSNLQRPDYGEIENVSMDMTNSMAYILNVQLYLTLEKARENVNQQLTHYYRLFMRLYSNQKSRIFFQAIVNFSPQLMKMNSQI